MHLAEMETEIQSATGAPNWYALFTRHQHEKSVAFALSNKSHEVYLPLYRSVRRWQDRAKALWLPLFPGYVFIREGMDRQLQILTTPGVIHIVKWGGRPAIVPQSQLDAVRQIIESCLQRGNSSVSAVRRSRTGQNWAFDGAGRDFDPQKRGGAAGRFHGNAGPFRSGGDRCFECGENRANPGPKLSRSVFRLGLK